MELNSLKNSCNNACSMKTRQKPSQSVTSFDNQKAPVYDKKLNPALLKAYYGISFSGLSVKAPSCEDFLNKFADLYDSPKELIKNAIKYTPIGAGGQGTVYAIPGMNDYLLKIPFWLDGDNYKEFKLDNFSSAKYDLDDINVGQPILETELLKQLDTIKILLKVKGEKFIDNNKNPEDLFVDHDLLYKFAYQNRLKIAAGMPQEAYDNLAKIALKLNELGHSIDPGIENILIEKGKSFNPIDIYFDCNTKTPFSNILRLIIGDEEYIEDLTDNDSKYLKIVIGKCIKSCQKEGILMVYDKSVSPNGNKKDLEYLRKLLSYTGIKVKLSDINKKYSKNFQDFETYIDNIFN